MKPYYYLPSIKWPVNLLVGLLLSFGLLTNVSAGAKPESTKPNILFISIDDLRTDLGAYGVKHIKTPNLDQLANEGRLFNRHYVQVPTCGPSRASMLTSTNIQARDKIYHNVLSDALIGTPEPKKPETFIHHFKQNGYYTVGMGKISHHATGMYSQKDKNGKRGKPVLELPHSWSHFVKMTKWYNNNLLHTYAEGKSRDVKTTPPFQMLDLPDTGYPDGILAEQAVDELAKRAKSKQPFLMAVGFFKPHLPFSAPKKYWDMYQRSAIPLSSNPDAPKDVNKNFLHSSSEFFGQYYSPPEERKKAQKNKRVSDDYARQIIHANLASVSYVDAQVGKVLDQLKKTGLDKNTIVVVWGDHGWHLGDHTIWGKHSSFERSYNSAFLVKTPQMAQVGTPTNGLVASIDIYPTLCDLAGLPTPASVQGKSFVQLLDNPNAKGKASVMSYWRDILSLRTDRYRLAVYQDDKEQHMMLFDHNNDPNETINVAKQNPAVIAELLPQIKKMNHGFLPDL